MERDHAPFESASFWYYIIIFILYNNKIDSSLQWHTSNVNCDKKQTDLMLHSYKQTFQKVVLQYAMEIKVSIK